MNKTTNFGIAGLALALAAFAAPASAAVIQSTSSDASCAPAAGCALYQLFTQYGPASLNTQAKIDAAQVHNDQYWAIGSSGGSVGTLIFQITANAGTNAFGIYDKSNSNNRVQLLPGSASPGAFPNGRYTVSIDTLTGNVFVSTEGSAFALAGNFASGNNFGFYLDSGSTLFFSDEALNPNNADQMAAFQGNGTDTINIPGIVNGLFLQNEYMLVWEDILALNADGSRNLGCDCDYNDFVVLVESVSPTVPEPMTLGLLGMGLIGLGAAARRRKAA